MCHGLLSGNSLVTPLFDLHRIDIPFVCQPDCSYKLHMQLMKSYTRKIFYLLFDSELVNQAFLKLTKSVIILVNLQEL